MPGLWRSIGVFLVIAALVLPAGLLPDNFRQCGVLWLMFTLPAMLQYGAAFAALASRRPSMPQAQARALDARLSVATVVAAFAAPAAALAPVAGVLLRSEDGMSTMEPSYLLLGVVFVVNLGVAGLVSRLEIDRRMFTLAALAAPVGMAAWVGLAGGLLRSIAVRVAPGGRDLGLGGLILLVTIPTAAAITGWAGAWLYARQLSGGQEGGSGEVA